MHYFTLKIIFIYTSTDNGVSTYKAHKKTSPGVTFRVLASIWLFRYSLMHPTCVVMLITCDSLGTHILTDHAQGQESQK